MKAANFLDVLSRIMTERNDEWAMAVKLRVQDEADLAAVKAVYHQQCNVNFRTFKKNPNCDGNAQKGAPVNERLIEPFLLLTQYIESSVVPYSTTELNEKFKEFSGGEMYSVRHLKDKLIQHFGDRLLFVSRNGLADIVVLREVSDKIIVKSYEEKFKSSEIEQAAVRIRNDIKMIQNNKHSYPLPDEITSVQANLSFMPSSLVTFLTIIFDQNKTDQTTKVISIGHAIIQVCRPRCLLSPIQLGLGVQIGHLTASR